MIEEVLEEEPGYIFISFLFSKEIYYYIKVSNSMINLGFINEIYYIYILSSKKYLLQFWLDKDIIKER